MGAQVIRKYITEPLTGLAIMLIFSLSLFFSVVAMIAVLLIDRFVEGGSRELGRRPDNWREDTH